MKMNRIIIAFGLMLLFLVSLIASEKEDMERGKDLYIQQCSKCHRKNGKGVKLVYPPLRDADYVQQGDKVELLRGMLFGREGKITVNGYTYRGVMTTEVDKSLSDKDIILILNYVFQELNGMKLRANLDDLKKARKAGKLPVHK